METCFNYCNENGYFSSDERRYITKIHKLKEKYPDEVRIIAEPEDNDGCIYCQLPRSWFRIQPPVKQNLTDEQRRERAEKMKRIIHASSRT